MGVPIISQWVYLGAMIEDGGCLKLERPSCERGCCCRPYRDLQRIRNSFALEDYFSELL